MKNERRPSRASALTNASRLDSRRALHSLEVVFSTLAASATREQWLRRPARQARNTIAAALQHQLWGSEPSGLEASGAPQFVQQLASCLEGATTWERGFFLERRTADGLVVFNGRVRLVVPEGDLVRPRRTRVGQFLWLALPAARPAATPGWFSARARAGAPAGPQLVVHLNLTPAGAVPLLEALLLNPNLSRARLEVRVVNDPARFAGPRSAMVCLEADGFAEVTAVLRSFHRRHRPMFRRGTPPLTLQLARGVSVMECSRGSTDAFWRERCGLLTRAFGQALISRVHWKVLAARAFERAGLRLEAPWEDRAPSALHHCSTWGDD